jgi:hypothetical protein
MLEEVSIDHYSFEVLEKVKAHENRKNPKPTRRK